MTSQVLRKVALTGNPNSGKSSLFNQLTGLNQRTGNFPGVTVDRHTGSTTLPDGSQATVIDLPGIYSLYPRSLDERIVAEILLNHRTPDCPDVIVVIADATNLKRSLLLTTQIMDLGFPVVLALSMMDLAAKAGLRYNLTELAKRLGIACVPVNPRTGEGVDVLKQEIQRAYLERITTAFQFSEEAMNAIRDVRSHLGVDNDYEAYQFLEQPHQLSFLSNENRQAIEKIRTDRKFFPGKFQGAEAIQRYEYIQQLLHRVTLQEARDTWKNYSMKLDRILTHRWAGYAIFFLVLFIIFQSIFSWASIPMDAIDGWFTRLSELAGHSLPEGVFTRLLAEGIIPGIGGILMFIPQIAILFAFIAFLEESGYMARVVFIMDRIMRRVGLSGRSVVPLISGVACAIPAIMATRTIDNWKERTITILVTPLMSCSARLPVFTILVALIVPANTYAGFFNLQGVALMSLYLLGFVAAVGSAWVMKKFIRVRERSYLLMELPTYRIPKWSNIGYTIIEKVKAFVWEAGKIIMAISVLLWLLASYGPGDHQEKAREYVELQSSHLRLTGQAMEARVAAYKLEHSYAGVIGKALEPVIRPLGYDWKIGIALLTSFAAREVFVGTLATIYSIDQTEEHETIKSRMKAEINPDTGEPRYTLAVGISLLLFYTFAMQCMTTLAVVYRETKGWKWPIIQLLYMTTLAYLSAFVAFQLLS
jgi:ferrous iron transport protein B